MSRDLVIDSITIEGLRGFNNAKTIELSGSHALISGPIGTGKSSTLCAIEWALFGDIAYITCSESRTQAEFVNANRIDQTARVTLKLKGSDGEYTIQREKHAKKRDSDLTFTTPLGEFEEDDAANQIYLIFGTFEDFHRSIFLHQEAVRDIITENPEERDSALDRLFGLERTRELMSSIPVKKVRKEYEKLDVEKTKLEERIKGASQQAEVEMNRAREEAVELGLKKDDFNISECIKRFKKITNKTVKTAGDCGVKEPSFLEPSTEKDVSKGLKKVKEVVKSCRMQIAATSKLTELQREERQINEAKEKLKKALSELKEAAEKYEEMKKEWGTIEQMKKQKEEFETKKTELESKRGAMDSKSRLVKDGIEVLSKQEIEKCPICDAKIPLKEVLSRLKTKISTALEEELLKIDRELKNIRKKLLQRAEHEEVMSKAITAVEEANGVKEDAEKLLGKILQSKSTGEKLLIEAGAALSELQKKLREADKALTEKNEILQQIDDSADMCRAIVRILDKEAEYDKIRNTFAEEDSQIKILKTQIAKMSSLHTSLQRISDAMATTQVSLAREFIGKGEKKISNYYGKLCGHPYYNSIKINVEQRNVRGVQKNTYKIRAFNNKEGKDTFISTRFSIGQMNSAALAIFLSLSSMLDRRPKFMILDDPSQSLDTQHKKRLIEVLNDVSRECQTIIATQETELEKEIRAGFMIDRGYVDLKYESWNKEGPIIKISKKRE